jgi:GNAT superfamily N-acetyltransferase
MDAAQPGLNARTRDTGPEAMRAAAPAEIALSSLQPCAAAPGQAQEEGGAFAIGPPTPRDAPSLALLWAEMQRHYGHPVPASAAAEAAAFACRAGPATGFAPRMLLAVAEGGAVVGAIALNVTFPATELTRSLYIRDLYVAAAARRRGVARALLGAAAALTLAEGFSALDWTTDAANAGARQLYEGAGARQMARVYYRLAGDDLLRVAGP